MATIDAYGVKFIGNDFVAPRVRQPAARRVPAQQPQYVAQAQPQPVYEAAAPVALQPQAPAVTHFSTQLAPAKLSRSLSNVTQWLTVRNGVIAASSVMLLAGLVVGAPRLPAAWHAVNRVGSRIALGARLDMHHGTQQGFVMPSNSLLVKDTQLSSFIDAIESQSVTITIGSKTVTPGPIDIQNWISQSAGPDKGTTIMQANQANISAYLAGLVQKDGSATTNYVSGSSSAAVTSATSQIAHELLRYNGATITLASS